MGIIAKRYSLDENGPYKIASGGGPTDKKTIILRDPSATCYIGGPTVDATEGMPVEAADIVTLELGPGDDLYIHAAGAATIQILLTRANASEFDTEA